mmetsp:Transcript_28544/g.72750  ORF Transcript_28544/g.72750 Transcript_28544/m.72750 type:complete len:95 (+) Transcript_28544:1361-1645(+)
MIKVVCANGGWGWGFREGAENRLVGCATNWLYHSISVNEYLFSATFTSSLFSLPGAVRTLHEATHSLPYPPSAAKTRVKIKIKRLLASTSVPRR